MKSIPSPSLNRKSQDDIADFNFLDSSWHEDVYIKELGCKSKTYGTLKPAFLNLVLINFIKNILRNYMSVASCT